MKRFFCALAAGALLLSLAACGGRTPGGSSSSAGDSSSSGSGSSSSSSFSASASSSAPEEAPPPEPSIPPISLNAYSPGSENSVPTKALLEFERLVEAASDGAIDLHVYHSDLLGDDEKAFDAARLGTVDIVFASTPSAASFYAPAKLLELPFLFRDEAQACAVTNGPAGRRLFEGPEEYGLVFLAEGDGGMRQLSTTNRAVHTAGDVQGLLIRVPTTRLYMDLWEELGATVVSLPLPELALALSNGTAQAQDNAAHHMTANNTYRHIRYFSQINCMWSGFTVAANAAKWEDLDPEVRELLTEQAAAAARYSFDVIAQDDQDAMARLRDSGVEIDLNPDVQSFRDALGGDSYYDRYQNESWFDRELLDALLAAR